MKKERVLKFGYKVSKLKLTISLGLIEILFEPSYIFNNSRYWYKPQFKFHYRYLACLFDKVFWFALLHLIWSARKFVLKVIFIVRWNIGATINGSFSKQYCTPFKYVTRVCEYKGITVSFEYYSKESRQLLQEDWGYDEGELKYYSAWADILITFDKDATKRYVKYTGSSNRESYRGFRFYSNKVAYRSYPQGFPLLGQRSSYSLLRLMEGFTCIKDYIRKPMSAKDYYSEAAYITYLNLPAIFEQKVYNELEGRELWHV